MALNKSPTISPPTSKTNYCALGQAAFGSVLRDATSDLQARCAVFSECAR
jgi:hypothetical protein